MGVSTKKSMTTNGTAPHKHIHDSVKKAFLTISLCVVVYFCSKPDKPPSSHVSQKWGSGDTSSSWSSSLLNARSEGGGSPAFWNAPDAGEFTPEIAWLMSYPNSGTSFTMTCIDQASNLSMATNYGDEVTEKDRFSIPIYPRHKEGPYWYGLHRTSGKVRHLPKRYVMVKTHCGSRCVRCPPNEYVESYDSFLDSCRNSSGRMAPDRKKATYLYDTNRVKKAIHLIRNPFHNFVARFHLDWKNYRAKGNTTWLEEHPSTAEGFQLWCKELDDKYQQEEHEIFDYDMVKQLRLSICHAEVFKYIQWHNLAFQVTDKLGLNPLIVHYEDYEGDTFQETVDNIMDYLELDAVQEPKEFSSNDSQYARYYTFLDKRRIRLLVEKIAFPRTWDAIKHYFDRNSSIYNTDLSRSHDVGKPPIGDK